MSSAQQTEPPQQKMAVCHPVAPKFRAVLSNNIAQAQAAGFPLSEIVAVLQLLLTAYTEILDREMSSPPKASEEKQPPEEKLVQRADPVEMAIMENELARGKRLVVP